MPKAELLTHMPNPVPSILVAHARKPHIILNLLLPFYYYIYQSASPIDNISHLHPQSIYLSPPSLHAPWSKTNPSHRTFCDDGNTLYASCPAQ